MYRRAVMLLAGLTVSGCAGSGDGYRPDLDLLPVADGMLQVDPRFELEPAPSLGAVLLLQRHTLELRAPDQRPLDFAYLELEPLARLTREESLHSFEETLAARRVLPDVLLQ
jgi:hypothetical protein